jgi:hypothetical protein
MYIILRNRHWYRFRTFVVVYFIFCFRKKIFFSIIQQYNCFFLETFFTFFDFFKINPKYFSQSRSCRIIRVLYRLPCEYAQKMRKRSCIFSPASFALLFVKKLCNTRFKRQDLHWGVVDSKMSFFTALKSDNARCVWYMH